MSTFTKLAYGTLIAAAGGTALYFASPRSTLITLDVATLVDATAEHVAASMAGERFTTNGLHLAGFGVPDTTFEDEGVTYTNVGYGTVTNVDDADDWNYFHPAVYQGDFDRTPLFGSISPVQAVNRSLATIQGIIPLFVDTVNSNNGTVTMLTVTGVFARLNIGDGTNKWTVGWSESGPVYGTRIGSVISTTTLWEAWRVLGVCTMTVENAQWFAGTNLSYYATAGGGYYEDSEGWLPDWTNWNLCLLAPVAPANSWGGLDVYYGYTNSGESVGAPFDALDCRGIQSAVNPGLGLGNLTTVGGSALTASRRSSTGGVWVASMADGASCSVTIPWVATGAYRRVSFGATNEYTAAVTGEQVTVVSFSGVSTNWGGFASLTNAPSTISDIVYDWYGDLVNGPEELYPVWFSDDPHLRWPVIDVQPQMIGRADVRFNGPAVLRWTFVHRPPED